MKTVPFATDNHKAVDLVQSLSQDDRNDLLDLILGSVNGFTFKDQETADGFKRTFSEITSGHHDDVSVLDEESALAMLQWRFHSIASHVPIPPPDCAPRAVKERYRRDARICNAVMVTIAWGYPILLLLGAAAVVVMLTVRGW